LELEELLEGAVVAALGGIDAAMEAGELFLAADEGAAGGDQIFLGATLMHGVLPDLGFGVAEAAELPRGGHHGVDQKEVFRRRGLEAGVVVDSEGFQGGRIFAGDDVGLSVDAGFEGIEAGDGLAPWGTRAGGFLRIEAVGLDLVDSGHKFRLQGSRRVGGRQAEAERKRFRFCRIQ
jgi:hypothetical protein